MPVSDDSPDCLVCLHQYSAIRSRHWHGVIAHVDLVPPQQHLPADLQSLVERSQQEHADTGAHHLYSQRNLSELTVNIFSNTVTLILAGVQANPLNSVPLFEPLLTSQY